MYGCSFLGFFSLGITYHTIVSAETLPEKKKYLKQKSPESAILNVYKIKARLGILLPSCRFKLDQKFLPIPTPLLSLV